MLYFLLNLPIRLSPSQLSSFPPTLWRTRFWLGLGDLGAITVPKPISMNVRLTLFFISIFLGPPPTLSVFNSQHYCPFLSTLSITVLLYPLSALMAVSVQLCPLSALLALSVFSVSIQCKLVKQCTNRCSNPLQGLTVLAFHVLKHTC